MGLVAPSGALPARHHKQIWAEGLVELHDEALNTASMQLSTSRRSARRSITTFGLPATTGVELQRGPSCLSAHHKHSIAIQAYELKQAISYQQT